MHVASSRIFIYVIHHLGKLGKKFHTSKFHSKIIECRFTIHVRVYYEVMSSPFQDGEVGKSLHLLDKITRRDCISEFLTYGLS